LEETLMPNHPRGLWIWKLHAIAADYLDRLKTCEVSRVYLKVVDGESFWSYQSSPAAISAIKAIGAEVYGWGYHYAVPDPSKEIAAVEKAMQCGLDGYVIDIEKEAENTSAVRPVEALVRGVRSTVDQKPLGYSSFGASQFHMNMPWRVLNEGTDFFMPQIYFELWHFAPTHEDIVQQCLAAVQALPSVKDVLPTWSSEDGAKHPATANELQSFLDRYPGSSIWRAPQGTEAGEAWNLDYGGRARPRLADLSERVRGGDYVMRPGSTGRSVYDLKQLLSALGYPSSGTSEVYDEPLEQAVRRFQQISGIAVDGKAGPETITALTGNLPSAESEQGIREHLAYLAQQEGNLQLRWDGTGSAAEKYLAPLRQEMVRRHQLTAAGAFYNWCGAFVLWCCREAGYDLPDAPAPTGPTFALVATWASWARQNDYWVDKNAEATRGDIVLFHWPSHSAYYDHIGIVSSFVESASRFGTSEGNTGNKTANLSRLKSDVAGFIRLPNERI
jgi:hypothetical protein